MVDWSPFVEEQVGQLSDSDCIEPPLEVSEDSVVIGEVVDGRVRRLYSAYYYALIEEKDVLTKEGMTARWRVKHENAEELRQTLSDSLHEICAENYKDEMLLIRKNWKIVMIRSGSLN